MRMPSHTYIALCQRYERWLTGSLRPEPGDWVVPRHGHPDEIHLVVTPIELVPEGVLVPRLERLLSQLAEECASFVLDYSGGEFACVAFDEHGRTLANVVAPEPSSAVAQALVFIRAERSVQEHRVSRQGE